MSKNNELQISKQGKDLIYTLPNSDSINNKKVVKEVQNAWKDSIVDETGFIWICSDRLHSILRTTTANAKYYIGQVSEEYKYKIKEKTYINCNGIISFLDQLISNADELKKREFREYSWKLYTNIRDCSDVKLIQSVFQQYIKSCKIGLKKSRIKQFKITKDELTNDDLDKKKSEFSHIRSYSIYRNLATNIDNGLIVNKSTHKIITRSEVNDEDQLLDLCVKFNWNIDWYEKYKEMISN